MPKKVLIVGGGLAGTIVANGLCRRLRGALDSGAVSLTMLGTTDTHFYQSGLLYIPFGRVREADLVRDQRALLDRRVAFFVDPAVSIDVDRREVVAASGRTFDYDYLVVATGSRIMPHLVPGMAEGAHWFYDIAGARRLRAALAAFAGGRIVLNVNAPHKCPVAPLELSFMLHDHLKTRGLWDKTELTYTYPIGRVHALEPVSQWARPEFDRRGIRYETFFNTRAVAPDARTITSEEGLTLPYDLLITVPPHQGAQVITDSKLGRGGWVSTNPKTLKYEGADDVFVVGDTTNIPISKAGSTAHFEADVVVDNLTALLQEGHWARDYDGKVFCFVDTSLSSGSYVSFNYATPPVLEPPSPAIHRLKLAYNRMYWLSARGLL